MLNNPRREAYATARAKGMTRKDAMEAAGYAPNGIKLDVDRDPEVVARISELMAPAVERVTVSVQELMEMFVSQGTYDPIIFENVDSLTTLKEKVPEALRRILVKSWKWDKNGKFTLILVDKDVAMDRIARHLSFYRDVMRVETVDYGSLLAKAEEAAGVTIEGTAVATDATTD